MKNLPFIEAVALMVGTSVGAGYLGIPYVVSKIGLGLGLAMIVLLGGVIFFQYLAIAEITLRTSGKHQITGYVEKYLGLTWKRFVEVLVILELYGTLLAYLVAEGDVLAEIFGGNPVVYSLLFFAVIAVVLSRKFKIIEEAELLLTLIMTLAVTLIITISSPEVHLGKLHHFDANYILPAYGVILFSFFAGSAIPEMRIALQNKEKKLMPAIFLGTVIPIVIYILFTIIVIGVTGESTTEVATIGLGQVMGRHMNIIGNILAAVTMTSAFLALALALKDTFQFDMRLGKKKALIFTLAGPLLIFLLGVDNFISILLFVGAVFGGLQGLVVIRTWLAASKRGDRVPEFVLPYKPVFASIMAIIFLIGIIYTFWSL